MSQNSLVLPTTGTVSGLTMAQDINNALDSLNTMNSGAGAPSTTEAYMLWADTTNDRIKQRNAANTGWVDKAALVGYEFVLTFQYWGTDYTITAGTEYYWMSPTIPVPAGKKLILKQLAFWAADAAGASFRLYPQNYAGSPTYSKLTYAANTGLNSEGWYTGLSDVVVDNSAGGSDAVCYIGIGTYNPSAPGTSAVLKNRLSFASLRFHVTG